MGCQKELRSYWVGPSRKFPSPSFRHRCCPLLALVICFRDPLWPERAHLRSCWNIYTMLAKKKKKKNSLCTVATWLRPHSHAPLPSEKAYVQKTCKGKQRQVEQTKATFLQLYDSAFLPEAPTDLVSLICPPRVMNNIAAILEKAPGVN